MKWRDSSQTPKPQEALDPYRFPGVRNFDDVPDPDPDTEPDPDADAEERPRGRISAAHHRRLALHAALTAAGIPRSPETFTPSKSSPHWTASPTRPSDDGSPAPDDSPHRTV